MRSRLHLVARRGAFLRRAARRNPAARRPGAWPDVSATASTAPPSPDARSCPHLGLRLAARLCRACASSAWRGWRRPAAPSPAYAHGRALAGLHRVGGARFQQGFVGPVVAAADLDALDLAAQRVPLAGADAQSLPPPGVVVQLGKASQVVGLRRMCLARPSSSKRMAKYTKHAKAAGNNKAVGLCRMWEVLALCTVHFSDGDAFCSNRHRRISARRGLDLFPGAPLSRRPTG